MGAGGFRGPFLANFLFFFFARFQSAIFPLFWCFLGTISCFFAGPKGLFVFLIFVAKEKKPCKWWVFASSQWFHIGVETQIKVLYARKTFLTRECLHCQRHSIHCHSDTCTATLHALLHCNVSMSWESCLAYVT